ncbi:MAG: hypothetical protein V3S89_12575 [Desulfobacterales bacterium]
MEKEIRGISFGMIAIRKGFVTEDQVRSALKIQSDDDDANKQHRPIGRILTDAGLVNDAQVYEILGALHKVGRLRLPLAG